MKTGLLVAIGAVVLAFAASTPARGQRAPAAPRAEAQPDLATGTVWTGETSVDHRTNRRTGELTVTSRQGDSFRGEWASWAPGRPTDISRWTVEGRLTRNTVEWRTMRQLSGPDMGGKSAEVNLKRDGDRLTGTWRVRGMGPGWKGQLWIVRTEGPGGVAALPRMVQASGYGGDDGLRRLAKELPKLAERGVSTLVLTVDYGFAFRSHPKVAAGPSPITRAGARAFAAACERQDIRLVPLVSCIGGQGSPRHPVGLLAARPELATVRDASKVPDGAEAEWNPLDEGAWDVVLALLDEVVDAFRADAVHVGLDGLRLLQHDAAATRDLDPGRVLADAVERLHGHLVDDRDLELWMWSEALLEPALRDGGASALPTHTAADRIPADVVVVDLHDEERDEAASAAYLVGHGLRVVVASSSSSSALRRLVEAGLATESEQLVGVMVAGWNHGRRVRGSTFLDEAVAMLDELARDR